MRSSCDSPTVIEYIGILSLFDIGIKTPPLAVPSSLVTIKPVIFDNSLNFSAC